MAIIKEGGSFETFNDVMGNPLIAINRDGTINTRGIDFADGTTQTTASNTSIPGLMTLFSSLPNVKIVASNKSFSGSNGGENYDIYTVPAGRRALLWNMLVNPASGTGPNAQGQGTQQYNSAIKVNGKYYYTGPVTTCSPTTAAAFKMNGAYIAEAGESLSLVSSALNDDGPLAVNSVAAAAGGSTVYTGAITSGGSNTYAGMTFVMAGFTHAANNGTFICTASSTTTLTLTNPNGVLENHFSGNVGIDTATATVYVISTVAAAATTALTLTSVQSETGGLSVYIGTITGGGSDVFAGYTFTITGFTNAANNGTFMCVASSTTTLTLINIGGKAETAAGTATSQSFTVYSNPNGFSGTFFPVGSLVTISGCSNPANNGKFLCLAAATLSYTLANPNGVSASSQTGSAQLNDNVFNVSSCIIEFDNTSALKTAKILDPVSGTNKLYTPSTGKNGVLVGNTMLGSAFNPGQTYVWWGNPSVNASVLTCNYLSGAPLVSPLTSASLAANGLTVYAGSINQGGSELVTDVTASAAAVDGTTTYTGSLTNGNLNLIGFKVLITGFTNAANNGLFTIVSSASSTFVVNNPNGVLQTAQVASAVASFFSGANFTITGFTNAGNNGVFPCVFASQNFLVVTNSGGVAETASGSASTPSIPTPSNRLVTLSSFSATNFTQNINALNMPNISNGDTLAVYLGQGMPVEQRSLIAAGGILWTNVIEF